MFEQCEQNPQRRSFTYERWFRAGIPWISSWMTRILNILGTTTLELVHQRGCGRQPRLTWTVAAKPRSTVAAGPWRSSAHLHIWMNLYTSNTSNTSFFDEHNLFPFISIATIHQFELRFWNSYPLQCPSSIWKRPDSCCRRVQRKI